MSKDDIVKIGPNFDVKTIGKCKLTKISLSNGHDTKIKNLTIQNDKNKQLMDQIQNKVGQIANFTNSF